MGTFDDLKEATEAAGLTPEGMAQLLKIEDICGSLTSIDFDGMTTIDFLTVKETLAAAGYPDEAIAELNKIKSLLVNA